MARRIIWASRPALASPIATDGRMIDAQPREPKVGTQSNCTAKTMISKKPIQKGGALMKAMEKPSTAWSGNLLSRQAASIPRGTAKITVTTTDPATSLRVSGRRSRTISEAGRCCQNDSPKSPVTNPKANSPYCSISGRLSPSCSRRASRSSSDASKGSDTAAGSVNTWVATNTSEVTTNTTSAAATTRRISHRSNAAAP